MARTKPTDLSFRIGTGGGGETVIYYDAFKQITRHTSNIMFTDILSNLKSRKLKHCFGQGPKLQRLHYYRGDWFDKDLSLSTAK